MPWAPTRTGVAPLAPADEFGNVFGWMGTAAKGIEFPRFRPGDSITKALSGGSYPKWFVLGAAHKATSIQGRYWMNRAAAAPEEFGGQLRRLQAGFAPQARILVRLPDGSTATRTVSKELHHHLGNRGVSPFDEPIYLREVWPWEHTPLYSQRRLGYEFINFID